MGLGAEEIVVPDVEHALEDGQVLLQRRGAEVLVDGVEARGASRRRPAGPMATMSEKPMAES